MAPQCDAGHDRPTVIRHIDGLEKPNHHRIPSRCDVEEANPRGTSMPGVDRWDHHRVIPLRSFVKNSAEPVTSLLSADKLDITG